MTWEGRHSIASLSSMDNPAKFYGIGSGPILIVGNGPSLNDIPNEFLEKYPSFGCNSIHLREGFRPTYYAVADDWIPGLWQRQYEVFRDIPKFCNARMPSLLNGFDGENLYKFNRKEGGVWIDQRKYGPDYLVDPGISYCGVTHAMIQIADWMGYEKFYLVGCDNTGDAKHFYQEQYHQNAFNPVVWEWEYGRLQVCLIPKPMFNLSTRGHIKALSWVDWKKL